MKRCFTTLWLLVLLPSLAAADENEVTTEQVRLLIHERVPFTLVGNSILLPVRQGTNLFHFILDTGASLNSLDPVFLPDLGPSIGTNRVQLAGYKNGEGREVKLYAPPEMYLGRLSLRNDTPVMVLDLRHLRELSGTKVSGVIGMGFMKDHIVRINFDESFVEFSQRVDEQDRPIPNPPMPPLDAIESPSIELLLPSGARERFFFDTGDNGGGALRSEVFDELVAAGLINDLQHNIPGALPGGNLQLTRGTVWPTLSFYGVEHRQVRLLRNDPSRLGMNVLTRHYLVFDFPRGFMYHAPRGEKQSPADGPPAAR